MKSSRNQSITLTGEGLIYLPYCDLAIDKGEYIKTRLQRNFGSDYAVIKVYLFIKTKIFSLQNSQVKTMVFRKKMCSVD
jgi:hypothetical protein